MKALFILVPMSDCGVPLLCAVDTTKWAYTYDYNQIVFNFPLSTLPWCVFFTYRSLGIEQGNGSAFMLRLCAD